MSRLPRPRARDLIRVLEKAGFVVVRVRGSHHRLKHPDGRLTTVPVHSGDVVGNSLLKAVLKQCEMTVDQLNELL